MKSATTVCATWCLIANINIVDIVEFYGRLFCLRLLEKFLRKAHKDTGKFKSFLKQQKERKEQWVVVSCFKPLTSKE